VLRILKKEADCHFALRNWKAKYQYLTPVIPATWEAKIRRIEVRDQPWQIVHKIPSLK
jgi:hypothetical protein